MSNDYVAGTMELENRERENRILEQEKRRISILRSGNTRAVIETIEEIRLDGNISILPEVFDLMADTEEESVINKCASLLNDIKSPDAAGLLVDALKEKKYTSIHSMLLAACWQNGLDYQKDILLFAEFLISSDYQASIEAFTVIENSLGKIEEHQRLKLIKMLTDKLSQATPEKQILMKSMISVIREY